MTMPHHDKSYLQGFNSFQIMNKNIQGIGWKNKKAYLCESTLNIQQSLGQQNQALRWLYILSRLYNSP